MHGIPAACAGKEECPRVIFWGPSAHDLALAGSTCDWKYEP